MKENRNIKYPSIWRSRDYWTKCLSITLTSTLSWMDKHSFVFYLGAGDIRLFRRGALKRSSRKTPNSGGNCFGFWRSTAGRRNTFVRRLYTKFVSKLNRDLIIHEVEVILKNRSCSEFKNFDKLELLALISIQNTNFIRDKEEQTKMKISYL